MARHDDNDFLAAFAIGAVLGVGATLLLRDNVSHRHDIERAYLKAIGEARQDIMTYIRGKIA